MAQLSRKWVMSCEQCIREIGIDRRLTCPPLQNPSEHITASDDAMQTAFVSELTPSCCYEILLRAMKVVSRYLFVYRTSNQDAKTTVKDLFKLMSKQAYLPTTKMFAQRSPFTSHVNKVVVGVLGTSLKHAKTTHAQTIGMLNSSHSSIKQSLKFERGD